MLEPGLRLQEGYFILTFPTHWLGAPKEAGCLSEGENMLTEVWINLKKLVMFERHGFMVRWVYPDRDQRDYVKICESIFRPGDLVEKRLNAKGLYGVPSKTCPKCNHAMYKGWSVADLENRSEKIKWICTNCGYEKDGGKT